MCIVGAHSAPLQKSLCALGKYVLTPYCSSDRTTAFLPRSLQFVQRHDWSMQSRRKCGYAMGLPKPFLSFGNRVNFRFGQEVGGATRWLTWK